MQVDDTKLKDSIKSVLDDDFDPNPNPDLPLYVKPVEKEEEKPASTTEEEKPNEEKPNEEEKSTTENTTTNTPSTEQTPNIFESLSEISNGLINNEDDFKGTIEKANQFTELETKYSTTLAENETLKNANPFANEYVQKLNALYSSGADADKITRFNRINQLGDIDALDSRAAVKWHLMDKFNLSESEAETKLKSTYKTDEALHSEDEIASSNIDLRIAANDAKSYLKEQQTSFEVKIPEVSTTAAATEEVKETPEQILAKQQEFETKIAPVVQNIEQELPTYFANVNTNGLKDDKAITIALPVPTEVQTQISSLVKQYASANQIDTSNPTKVQELKTYASNLAKMIMFDAWVIDASNKREESVLASLHNPSNIDRGKNNPQAPAKTSEAATASTVASTM